MDNLVNNNLCYYLSADFSGYTGTNDAGQIEIESGLYVSKAGARRFPKGFVYDGSKHQHIEWGAVLSGKINISMGNNTYSVPQGSSYVLRYDELVKVDAVDNPLIVWLEVKGFLSEKILFKNKLNPHNLIIENYNKMQIIHALHIAMLLQNHHIGYSLFAHAELWKFISHYLQPETAKGAQSPEIISVIKVIEESSADATFALEELAKISGLSYETFRKRFRREVGESPMQYLVKHKLGLAKSLMNDPSITISELSDLVGINDPYYFSRIFKLHEGISPSQFRKRFFPEQFY